MSFITWWEKPNKTVPLILLLSLNNRKLKGSNHFKIHIDVLKYNSNWLLEMMFNFIGSKCKKNITRKQAKNNNNHINNKSSRKIYICKMLTTTF